MTRYLTAAILALALSASLAGKSNLRIAVASNFQKTLENIVESYQENHPETTITLIPGSSGKLYAQIANGAPFDAFFSADRDRPLALEKNGHLPPGTRFTFALGVLALWQPGSNPPDFAKARTLALANPKLAPFGRAASEALATIDFPADAPRQIIGSSVSQTFNFVQSGAADTGLVSCSQLLQMEIPSSEYLILDTSLYQPIEQQAIALSDDDETAAFLRFCQSDTARSIILAAGYRLPETPAP